MPNPGTAVERSERDPLADRIVALLATRGYTGITQGELLRNLEISPDELRAALGQLEADEVVRVAWTAIDSYRVFYTG